VTWLFATVFVDSGVDLAINGCKEADQQKSLNHEVCKRLDCHEEVDVSTISGELS